MIKGRFDINGFFRRGFTVTEIEKEAADFYLAEVEKQPFVEGDHFYASENFGAPLISKWESTHIVPSHNREAPSVFKKFWDDLSGHSYFEWFTKNFGPFSQGSPMINQYRKNDGMVWHTDSYDATFMTNILYLSRDNLSLEDGGYLSVGRCSLNEHGVVDKDTIIHYADILPNHGVLVTVNNIDHTTLHRVAPMAVSKQRISLLCHLGYAEQTLTRNRLKKVRGL
jgi:hypothetical protein